jgi:hypothetical protein
MKPATAKQTVNSVLEYIAGFIQFAQLRNDLNAVWHWQECWCVMFGAFFGSYTPAHRAAPQRLPDTVVSTPLVRPRWFIEKYSRPARKVVGRTTERESSGRVRECFSINYDVLECGHKIEAQYGNNGTCKSRWRYCRACPPKDQQMREAGMTGSRAVTVQGRKQAAFAVTGAVNTISRASRVSRRAA